MLRNCVRSKVMLGGLIGSLAIVFWLSSPVLLPSITAQDAVLDNPISTKNLKTTVGEELLSTNSQVLSLTEIFERSEKGVVSITVQKPSSILGSGGLASGFVYDDQ
ncbi:MAG: hypothetical protein IIA81_08040, partial [Thaumarchaeota archaeon]|nr:hypothetical protein [Nitrososphaerota archaeon]